MFLGWMVFIGLSTLGTAAAVTDPNVGPSDTTPAESPFSERCQRAFTTYAFEAEWFRKHNTLPIQDPQFNFHDDRWWDAWYIAELECGVDIDNNGVLG